MGEGSVPPLIEQLVKRYAQDVYRYAYRLTGSAADAEDLTQETFLAAVKNIHQLANPESARSWLFTIARNQFLVRHRRGRGTVVRPLGDQAEEIMVLESGDSDEVDGELIQNALNALSDEQRVILLMFYFEEASYREIAEQLGIPIGTVMSRLSRAKEALRKKVLAATRQDSDL
ncbi:RNA polymerase sigma-54 factor RpoN [Thermogutta terrifontis]|jgi:RNA polymerase sigma-70 factor (ECF subfamily)|uniref:RNA polymerase sigma-54 factor RpoN n=1 Tax=Thermogutta terrifontis TaxID=1331910 RepID=A0A286RG10_9BACT|nr:sigma-70 family RNA polymerase sigma factor [Thermogutta terrifontis]ASV74901.1 RNA polymerase sigma-54 factor RpoN [Thermogutta terrifontis]